MCNCKRAREREQMSARVWRLPLFVLARRANMNTTAELHQRDCLQVECVRVCNDYHANRILNSFAPSIALQPAQARASGGDAGEMFANEVGAGDRGDGAFLALKDEVVEGEGPLDKALLRLGGEAMCRTGERVEDWPGANRGVGDMEKKSSSQDDGQGLPDVEIATGRQAASRGTAVMRGDIK